MKDGQFVWYDLAALDPKAAAAFYAEVVGWEVEDVPELNYTLLKAGGVRVAGLMTLPEAVRSAGVPPHWTGYVLAQDVDAKAQEAAGLGATLRHGPEDIPGVGRFALMTDPGGAPFHLFAARGEPQAEPPPMTPGHIGWHELVAKDHAAAFDFYAGLFGWEKSRAIDMGPMGTYQLFAYDGLDRGGMMDAPPGLPAHWCFYFVVAGLDAAQGRMERAGGTVLHGPVEVPGGAWIVMGTDPQGAKFALVSAAR